ncbi:guanylate kinase [Aneurinibacillus tyrosinisolvens]|uniref:guanylate kinase n=1 Tax=Aneurinibacillus tyrosinisolvens TaxID=1443435 RepID=UPI00063FA98B|nr:guanylate kinase [Aneurinibacillus tyrosinisolvens]
MFNLNEQSYIFVFTGPDGAGRKTVAEMIHRSLHIPPVISYTTRPKKPMEVDRQDYYFISEESFALSEKNNEFLETIKMDGYSYGLKEKDIEELFENNRSIIMVLNAEGTKTIKKMYGDRVIRFFIYENTDVVEERQKQRGDSQEDILRHTAHYEENMQYKEECEHAYKNFDSSHTAFDITKLLENYLDEKFLEE